MEDEEDALLAVDAPAETKEEIRERKEAGRGQLAALRARLVKAQRKRVSFLLGQSELFAHFLKVSGNGDGRSLMNAAASPAAGASVAASPTPTRRRERASAAAEADDEDAAARALGVDEPSAAEAAAGGAPPPPRRAGRPRRVGGGAGGAGPASSAAASGSGDEEEDQEAAEAPRLTSQPTCVTGEMRDYQLEGLNWMLGLHYNGINGILADVSRAYRSRGIAQHEHVSCSHTRQRSLGATPTKSHAYVLILP